METKTITQEIYVLQARVEGLKDLLKMIRNSAPEGHPARFGVDLAEEKVDAIEEDAKRIGDRVCELEEWAEEVSR